ncbi:type II toxin-antitoxin system PemK/MazF family toxin [Methanoregula sp.]|jgi:mRNA interferase MazF|uniref:type II toxin-antitoxin system PemK/MazF family toxin n=1 Tax=Methanoregula sp. TaxID=2052170 RepID=UPI003C71AAD0
MGRYVRGDVILASVPFEERHGTKTRPALVVSVRENGDLIVCPISSRPPSDAPCIPIGLDDFSEGGLDLFSESFVLTAKVSTIWAGEVIGLKGRLTADAIAEMGTQVQLPSHATVTSRKKSR